MSSIVEVAKAYDQGLSPVAIVEECLARIEAQNSTINAMISVDIAGALAAARLAEREIRSRQRRGPLHGIPIAIKDIIDVAGWPTTAGSRLFDGHIAQQDAACIAYLRAAGAIILGKTNLHELTVGGHDNTWFGKVVNPLDESRGTAGTSSGSAGAVAAGFCVAAVGTDTGGSNRSVAAATGLVGFRPSNGLINPTGSMPTAASLDAIGPIASTVADACLLTDVLSGGALPAPQERQPNGLVVATCPDLYNAAIDPAVAADYQTWLGQLHLSGARIVEIPFTDGQAFVDAGITILMYEFAQHYGSLIRQHPDRVGAPALAFTEAALGVTQATFKAAVIVRKQAKLQMLVRMEGVDVLAIPTSPGLAPRLSDEHTRVGATMVPYGPAGGSFRRWANMLGMPAVAIPLPTDDGLPASVQIAARSGEDGRLLDIARSLSSLV